MRQLYVYFNDTKAGLLTELQLGRGYIFQYDKDYLASSLPPISVTLPKRAEPYEDDYLFPLFTNIIPEGGNRRVICRYYRIDERDFFGILSAMAGADFIGAVNVRKIDDTD
jgi:serine/threonine-protein kinase HipA